MCNKDDEEWDRDDKNIAQIATILQALPPKTSKIKQSSYFLTIIFRFFTIR